MAPWHERRPDTNARRSDATVRSGLSARRFGLHIWGRAMTGHNEHDTHKQDMKVLHEMGYAQELHRSMSSFSNFAISFSIICILSGGINSLGQATAGAGGAAIGIGWPVGVILSGLFAVALAQI